MANPSKSTLQKQLLSESKQSNAMRLKRNTAKSIKAKRAWQTLIDLSDESRRKLKLKISKM